MTDATNAFSVSALLVGEYPNDRLLVHEIFRGTGWRLFEAHDRRYAMRCLTSKSIHVVIAQADMLQWSWKRILIDLRRFAPTPQLIVASRTADDYLWSEVLNFGGFDVLAQPFERDEVERVIAAARRHFGLQPMLAGSVKAARAASAA